MDREPLSDGWSSVGIECEKFTVGMARSMEADLRADKAKWKQIAANFKYMTGGILLGIMIVIIFAVIRWIAIAHSATGFAP